MAFFNSYILYNKNNIEKKQNYTEYRLQIAEALLQNRYKIIKDEDNSRMEIQQ